MGIEGRRPISKRGKAESGSNKRQNSKKTIQPTVEEPANRGNLTGQKSEFPKQLMLAMAKLQANIERNRPLHVKLFDWLSSLISPGRWAQQRIRRSILFDEAFYLKFNEDVLLG